MRSIRAYLLSRLLGGSLVILLIAGAAVYFAVARSLARRFDENLHDRVLGFASILFQTAEDLEFEFSDELMPEYARSDAPAYFDLGVVGGESIERSTSLAGHTLDVPGTPDAEPIYWDLELPDGRAGRAIAQIIEVHHVYPEEGEGRPTPARVQVVIARGREALVAEERELLAWCAGTCLVLGGLIGFISWRSVDRALQPARRLATALDALDVERLPERLDIGEVPKELAPVAEKSDALIRRVDAALQRERRTTADIAHELRTPLSELVTVTEVALRNGHDPEHSARALSTARDVAWRMGRTLSTLLRLARLHAHAESFESVEVEVAELVTEALRSGKTPLLRLENQVDAADRMRGDREVLRIVIGNLIGNALCYTPAGGFVRCRVERAGSSELTEQAVLPERAELAARTRFAERSEIAEHGEFAERGESAGRARLAERSEHAGRNELSESTGRSARGARTDPPDPIEADVALVLENGPVDLAPEDLHSLGEPFWRKDGARSDRARSGLGLALSRALCERSGLSLELALEGTTFRARLAPIGAAVQGTRVAR